MLRKLTLLYCTGILLSSSLPTIANAQQPPPTRYHTVNQIQELKLRSATVAPITTNRVSIDIIDGKRIITANGISRHPTGQFPGQGNPNKISEQSLKFTLPVKPIKRDHPMTYQLGIFGIGVNGVLFEPQAAEWFHGKRGSVWQYDALGGALPLGFDAHSAHVQPNGSYHYHGLPKGLLKRLHISANQPSAMVGWALDGFPIYALFAKDKNGTVQKMTSSYRLKSGMRSNGNGQPGGIYDGAFVADWEFEEGRGNLDKCNGAKIYNSAFPQGTYAYFLTENFPVIPRCFYGRPVQSGPGQRPASNRSQRGHPDLNSAAKALGISTLQLRRALGPPPPDLSRAAARLGIDVRTLREALQQ
jgi:YHYH protein